MPIDQITRQLNLAEERSLRRTLSREQHRLRVMPRRIFFFGLSVFGILWGSTALAEKGSHLLATANFWLVLTIPMLLWAYISASSDVKAAVSQIQNGDFCLNQILDNDGKVVEELISKRGRKLEPLRTISTGVRLKLRVPDHLEVIRGRLENLEAILANDGPHSARSNSPRQRLS